MFPRMQADDTTRSREAATECQDLMGMSFRTFHFDGVVRVPGYIAWLMDSATCARHTRTTGRCSSFCSGTARRTCGI